jgi:hypothetical protein
MSHFRLLAISAGLAWSLLLSPSLSAAEEHGHAHSHGEQVALGKTSIGTTAVTVTGAGDLVAGQEWHLGVALAPGASVPKAIRVWIGAEHGRGSERSRAQMISAGKYEAHVAVPKPLPAGSAVWIAIESAAGATEKGTLPLPETDSGQKRHRHGDDH